jgi:nitroimidazol reductase NimA-like FMN-containing flavoprotein (pyridoxamine 5'-phosphate oxidase superfamily)
VEYEEARMKAYAVLQERAVWWEPAYISQQHRDQPHSLTPIFYRIHIDKITGHRAKSEESETSALTPSKRQWLEKLLDP